MSGAVLLPSAQALGWVYFGKVPARGDFVRSPHSPALVHTLDRWLTAGLEALSADIHWKRLYDAAPSTDFLLSSTRAARGLAGHLVPSRDASGRRFPFIAARPVSWPESAGGIVGAPHALQPVWEHLARRAREATRSDDAARAVASLAEGDVGTLSADGTVVASALSGFLDAETVGHLDTLLWEGRHRTPLRQMLLALGLLLGPVLTSGARRLDKGLALPLPADRVLAPVVAHWWMVLVQGFLERAEFELMLLRPAPTMDRPHVMLLSLQGASPRVLHALLDPAVQTESYISLADADWVESCVAEDAGLHKLSSYLRQPGLSLRQATATFKEVFLGE